MLLKYITSSTIYIEEGDTSLLCDPWLYDGAFLGSWAHYPPVEVSPEQFRNLDYIYISHIHPDHFHEPTLQDFNKDIPILLHDFQWNTLKNKVERLGFEVIELPHNERVHLKGDLHINILGADDCDPEVCGNYFGCNWWMESAVETTTGSTQIDSMAVIDNGNSTIINANDCRWPLSKSACASIKDTYETIDFLLVQYSAANFYPQCMYNYPHRKKLVAAEEVKKEMLEDAVNFIEFLEPSYYMPFAGSYTLSGDLAELNIFRAVPERIEAYSYFSQHSSINQNKRSCIILNSGEQFSLITEEASSSYNPINQQKKESYIQNELTSRNFPYQSDSIPDLGELENLVEHAYNHLEQKRTRLGYSSDTKVILPLREGTEARISMNGTGYQIQSNCKTGYAAPYVKMRIDPRLLFNILSKEKKAHFNNAQIGSHIQFEKQPDIYERPLYYCMSFFHE